MDHPFRPSLHVYVLKLACPAAPGSREVCGRIEHAASGRRHDFDSAQALLDCLRHEERQVVASLSAAPPDGPGDSAAAAGARHGPAIDDGQA